MRKRMTKPRMACAPSEDSDQPGLPPSLIRVFAVRMKKAWVLSYLLSAEQRLWSDWANAQADLSLRWAHMPFCRLCHALAHICSLFHIHYRDVGTKVASVTVLIPLPIMQNLKQTNTITKRHNTHFFFRLSVPSSSTNISDDTQKISQSRSTALMAYQKKKRWGTNKDTTNVTYETTDAQRKKNCNRETALEWSVEKTKRKAYVLRITWHCLVHIMSANTYVTYGHQASRNAAFSLLGERVCYTSFGKIS